MLSVNPLLEQLLDAPNIDRGQALKESYLQHRMSNALYSVFSDIKKKLSKAKFTSIQARGEVKALNLTESTETCNQLEGQIMALFHEHSKVRPITSLEMGAIMDGVRRQLLSSWQILEQQPKKRRRNFSKEATEILNGYFYSHLANPYPSEEAKEALARKCGITISQVSNWFGNKRIRYKKSLAGGPDKKQMYESGQL